MKPITMTPETALDRAALIAAQDADAPKLTQRMDAEAMRVLVEHVNALRARVAELDRKLSACSDERRAEWVRAENAEGRVAELEAENEERRIAFDDALNELREQIAHANALRDALVKACKDVRLPYDECDAACNHCARPWDAHREGCIVAAALASTPAASLAAHDAEVLERAAKVCDERAAQWRKLEDQYRERGQREFMEVACVHRQAAESLAAAIRALAAQAQERTEEQWECPTCGLGVAADEDGCCATCGADCNRQEVKS